MDTNSNLPPNASNNAPAQSTDWAAVRSFYLTCRSYKQTAEHFCLNPDTIKTRCRREDWKNMTPEPSQEVQTVNSEPSSVNPVPSQEVQTVNSEPSSVNPEPSQEVQTGDVEPSVEPSDVNPEPSADAFAAASTCFQALPMRENLISSSIRFGQPWLISCAIKPPTAPTSATRLRKIACSAASAA